MILALSVVAALAGCVDRAGESARSTDAEWNNSFDLIEELRIGVLEGDSSLVFGRVQTVVPGPDGGVFVADAMGPSIRLFGSDGSHLRDVGRSGQGPGEYASLDGMGLTASGALVVLDGRLGRVSVFSPLGEFVRSVQVEGIAPPDRGHAVGEDGTVYTRGRKASGAEPLRDSRGLIDWGTAFDWVAIQGDGTTHHLGPLEPEDAEGLAYIVEGRGGPYRPMITMTLSTIGPDGTAYWARNDEYRVFRRDADGEGVLVERASATPISLTDEELEEWTVRSETYVERNPTRRERYLPIPRTKPLIRELAVDLDGRIWVSRYTEAVFVPHSERERAYREQEGLPTHQWRDEPIWDVYLPDGSFHGAVTLPMNTTFMTARGDRVWGVQAGEQREDYVVQWRMTGSDP